MAVRGRSRVIGMPVRRSAASLIPSEARPAPDLIGLVRATPLTTTPFHHVYVEHVFSPGYYQQMLDALPETRAYREFHHRDAMRADGHSARRKFYLLPEHIMRLPARQRTIWLELSRLLRSRELQEAFKAKFRVALEGRFGRPIGRLSFYPVPILLRDFPGYRIGIHGDSLGKAITVQFYLPRDDTQSHLGTIFHDGRNGEAALRTRHLAFRPASGYAFPVLYHQSWHSVAPMTDGDGPRDSLMLTYYVQDGVPRWLLPRLKRFWTFLVYDVRR